MVRNTTLYGLPPAVLFEAAVHILRQDIPAAKDVVSGELQEYPGVGELLGASTAVHAHVLSWADGNNNFIPRNIDHFFERAFLEQSLLNPEKLTCLGFLEQAGITNHNGYLQQSPSQRHEHLLHKSNEYLLAALQDTARWKSLTTEQRVSHRILLWSVENSNRTFRDQIYPVTQLEGVHSQFVMLMSDFAIIQSLADIQLYESRLGQARMKFDLVVSDMRRKREMGIMPPKSCLEKVARGISGIIENLQQEENTFTTAVKSKYNSATKSELPAEILHRLNTKIRNWVIPGYRTLLAEVQVCVAHATDDPGVWKLPDGDQFYKHCLKWETTTDYTPETVHQLGLDNVQQVLQNIQNVIKQLNAKGDMRLNAARPVVENLKILAEDEAFLYEDTEAAREECIAEYEELLSQISKVVQHMFNNVPGSRCVVKPMPRSMGECGAVGCYFPGLLDLSRPGVFYVNTTNIKSQNKSQMRSLTAHEAVPGHHYQISYQLENSKLPYFRRRTKGYFTGYSEGWGLYAEHLGKETGFYHDTDGSAGYSVLGYYCAELLRSARLVVDTGLNKMRWSRPQAIDFLINKTGMEARWSEDEVDRYCVMPGQACCYKIGQLRLLDIRRRLENRPGFDIKLFHDRILDIGSVPLGILEELLLEEGVGASPPFLPLGSSIRANGHV